jgi:hypothetical protein
MNLSSASPIQSDQTPSTDSHNGPHPGIVAIIYVALFIAGLIVVSGFVTRPSFPAPDTSPQAIVAYFQLNPSPIRISAFLSFGAAITLAIFVSCVFSRLRFLGIRATWVDLALVAGLVTASDQVASHLCEWALTWPGIAQNSAPTLALYYLLDAFGSAGFSVPMALFVGSISLVAARWSLLPRWLVYCGFVISAIGIISWLNLLLPTSPLLPLTIPLTRFPAFAWIIITGFMLPRVLPVTKQTTA